MTFAISCCALSDQQRTRLSGDPSILHFSVAWLHKAGFNFNLSSFLSSFSSFSQWWYSVTSLVYWQNFWHLQKSRDRDRRQGDLEYGVRSMKPPEQFRQLLHSGGRTGGRQWKAAAVAAAAVAHSGRSQRLTDRPKKPTGGGGGARRRQLWPQMRRHTSLATKIAGGGTFGLNIAAAHMWRRGGGGGAHGLGRWRWRGADSMYVLCCYEDTYWQTRLGLFLDFDALL